MMLPKAADAYRRMVGLVAKDHGFTKNPEAAAQARTVLRQLIRGSIELDPVQANGARPAHVEAHFNLQRMALLAPIGSVVAGARFGTFRRSVRIGRDPDGLAGPSPAVFISASSTSSSSAHCRSDLLTCRIRCRNSSSLARRDSHEPVAIRPDDCLQFATTVAHWRRATLLLFASSCSSSVRIRSMRRARSRNNSSYGA